MCMLLLITQLIHRADLLTEHFYGVAPLWKFKSIRNKVQKNLLEALAVGVDHEILFFITISVLFEADHIYIYRYS